MARNSAFMPSLRLILKQNKLLSSVDINKSPYSQSNCNCLSDIFALKLYFPFYKLKHSRHFSFSNYFFFLCFMIKILLLRIKIELEVKLSINVNKIIYSNFMNLVNLIHLKILYLNK